MLPAASIADNVRSGKQTATSILESCLNRIDTHDDAVGAIAVPLDALSRQTAERVDSQVANGEDPGPLAGVPFTIKECYHVEGTPHSLGRVHIDEVATAHSPIVQRLINAGAIPVAKTNLSQLMLLYETDNPRYGRTNHPHFPDRSPGGSGGGDAAALAADYACFAIGTDMGGSIRHPAHCCGLAGFLPTVNRIESAGVERILPGVTPVELQASVMGQRTDDVQQVMQVLSDDHPKDGCFAASWIPSTTPLNQLRIGYWETDHYFEACPTAQRAVRESVARLESLGVDCRPVAPPDHEESLHLYCAIFGSDGGERIRDRLRNERVDTRTQPFLRLGRLPRLVRRWIAHVVRWFGDPRLAGILHNSYRCSASTLWQLTELIDQYRAEFFQRMQNLGLDAIVMPPHATVAFRHGASKYMLPGASYSMLANVLGSPAGVAHVTHVREDEQAMLSPDRSRTGREANRNLRDSVGLPCGVQVMGSPWDDAKVLQIMAAIEQPVEHPPVKTRPSGPSAPSIPTALTL